MNRLAELDKLEELLKADGIPYERLDEDLTGRLSADAMKMLQEKGFYCKDFRHTVKIPNTKDKSFAAAAPRLSRETHLFHLTTTDCLSPEAAQSQTQ